MKRKIKLMITLTLVIVMLCACGRNNIVGKWYGDGETVEFFKDGTMSVDGFPGKYSASNGELNVQWLGISFSYDYEVEGDTLTLIDDKDGEITIYESVD